MIQSSDYRVLSIGGYSYMDYITGAGIYSKEKIDMTNFGIHSSTIDKCSIPTLKRNGLQDGGTYGLVDNLTYNGNQLTKISDSVEDPTYVGAFNFKDGADNSTEYTYDAVGNMTSDKNKGITSITYNDINQPQKITFSDGKTTEYVYSYDGTKLQTVHKTLQPQTSTTTTYCGNLIYENGALKQMLVDGGYVTFSGATPVYHFYIQDHLGNNRVVAKADGTVEQINHYYPYGGLMADICTGSDVQPYKYNGKELDRMHGLDTYDYGARQHNAATGRWDRMDQKCEKYYDVSPYVYCHNNPIMLIDIDGMDDFFDSRGKFLFTYGAGARMYIKQGNHYVDMRYFNLRNLSKMQVAANVVGYYANAVGVKYNMNGGKGHVGISTLHNVKGSGRILAGTTKGNIYIKMANGKLDEYMYDSNQLKGTLRHENEHKKMQDKGKGKANDLQHAQIILTEIQGHEFENCSQEYQNAQIEQFELYLNNVEKNKENGETINKLYEILHELKK